MNKKLRKIFFLKYFSAPAKIDLATLIVLGLLFLAVIVIALISTGTFFRQAEALPFEDKVTYDATNAKSITKGDFNNDGNVDVAVGSYNQFGGDRTVTIFLSDANGVFTKGQELSCNSPYSLISLDLNNDTFLDLIVANYIPQNTPPNYTLYQGITVFIGNGDGSFQGGINYGTDSYAYDLAGKDIDNDGNDDLVVSLYRGARIAVFKGVGDGTLIFDNNYSVGTNPSGILLEDLNNDSRDDIAVATSNGFSVIFGNSDITFQGLTQYTTDNSNLGITYGDFNNDTFVDLATVGTDLAVHLGDGAGNFLTGYQAEAIANYLEVADVNNDGISDLIASKNNALLFIGNNDGTFVDSGVFQISGSVFWYANSIVIEDFDHDGRLDLAAGANNYLSVLFNLDRPYITSISPVAAFVGSPEIDMVITGSDFDSNSVVRINDDDLTTVYISSHELEATIPVSYLSEVKIHNITIYNPSQSQESSARFFYVEPGFFDSVNETVGNSPVSSYSADFNSDNINDIAIVNQADDNIQILLGQGDGFFVDPVTTVYTVGSNPSFVSGGDYNNDTFIDLAITNSSDNNVSILLGDGAGEFISGTDIAVGLQPSYVISADFNSDNNFDLAVVNMSSNSASILLGAGSGLFTVASTLTTNNSPVSIESADFNNDTFLDLVSVNRDSGDVSVYLGNNDGSFNVPEIISVGAVPYSATVGDYNNDNFNDIAVANSLDDNIEILLGSGDGNFSSSGIFDVGVLPRSVISNDFNQDGNVDLAVVNSGSDDVYVLLGSGNASFNSTVTYSVGDGPLDIVLSDLNNDDFVDLIAINGSSNNFSVLLKKIIIEIELFQDKVNYSVGNWPTGIGSGDFDGDGAKDLAVVNSGVDTISILKNNGSGVFTSIAEVPTSDAPNSLTIGDFNNDNREDLASVTGSNFSVFLGKEDGTLPNPISYSLDNWPVNFTNADFNNDGVIDLAIANSTNMTVVFGSGNGVYTNPTDYTAGTWPKGIMSGDFNGDSQIDIAVVNSGSDNISIFINNGNGTFSAAINYNTGANPYDLVVQDLNNDTHLDLLVGRYFEPPFQCIMWECGTPWEDPRCSTIDCDVSGDGVYALFGAGNGTFGSSVSYANLASAKFIVSTDLNNDTYHDVVGGLQDSNQFFTMFNNGNGTFALPVFYNINSYSESIVTCDLNNDNNVDVVVSNRSTKQISIFSNNGLGVLSLETEIDLDIIPSSLLCVDLDLDTNFDLVVGSSYNITTLPVMLGDGNYNFQFVGNYSSTGPVSALVDFDSNDDGYFDIVAVDNSHKKIATLINNGDGTLDTPLIYSGGGYHILNDDFNNDSNLDLVVGSRLNIGNGDGTFTQQPSNIPGLTTRASINGDFNLDGNMDISGVDYGNDRIAVSLGNGDGDFTGPDYYPVGVNPEDILTADFNNDSISDLVVGNRTSASVSVLLGIGDGTFDPALNSNIYYSLNSITNGDFNGDEQQDLAVLNDPNYLSILLGLNNGTFQQPINYEVGQTPYSIITDDFNNDDKPDLALTNWFDSEISVFLGLRQSAVSYTSGYVDRPTSTGSVECQSMSNESIFWYFEDISNNETGYKLYSYDDGLLKIQEGTDLEFILEDELDANMLYSERYVRSYNNSGESKASGADSCYTLANQPLSLIIESELSDPTLFNVIIDSADNNPSYTEYSIYELYSNQYVQPDGSLLAEISWLPYLSEEELVLDWGGDSGLIISLPNQYKLIAYSRNGDNIATGTLPTEVYFNCGAYSSNEIKWTMRDTQYQGQFDYRLYAPVEEVEDTLIVEIPGLEETIVNYLESELSANTKYSRYFNVYDYELDQVSVNSLTMGCYTLPNEPLPIIIGEVTDETVQVIIDDSDGNPEWTKYSLFEVIRGKYVQLVEDESGQLTAILGDEPMWLTYQEWGGFDGIIVFIEEAQTTVKNYFINIANAQSLDFQFEADVQNEDGVILSEFEPEIDEVIGAPALVATKMSGVKTGGISFKNLGRQIFAANSNLTQKGFYSVIHQFSFLLNLVILILMVLLILSLVNAAKYLFKQKDRLIHKVVLGLKMLTNHPVKTFTDHAAKSRNGTYAVAYTRHKDHSQKHKKIFKNALLLLGIKVVIIIILVIGTVSVNQIIAQEFKITMDEQQQVSVGEQILYRIDFTNSGDDSANKVVLKDELSVNIQYVENSAKLYISGQEILDSITYENNLLIVSLGDLAINDSGNFEFVGSVLSGSEGTNIINQAELSGENFTSIITNSTINPVAELISVEDEKIEDLTISEEIETQEPITSGTPIENKLPVVGNDSVQINQNESISIDVLLNDIDLDGQIVLETLKINQSPLNGSAEVIGSKITYSPNQDYFGSDSFSYQICDNQDGCEIGIVGILIAELPLSVEEEGIKEVDLKEKSIALLFFDAISTDITETKSAQQVIDKLKENKTIKKIIENPVVNTISEKILNNPQVEQVNQNIVTPALVTVAVVNTIPAAIPVSINFWSYLHFLFFEPFIFFFRRKRKKWGVVYDSLSKMPIGLAVIRLYHKETRDLIQTKVTDNYGRYLMIVKEPGHYYLTVTKLGYEYPTDLLKDDQSDEKYLDIYHGEEIEVNEGGIILTTNIPLDKKAQEYLSSKEVLKKFFKKNLRLMISYAGFVLSILVFIIYPSIITVVAIGLHVLLYLLFRKIIVPKKTKNWGIVYDLKTKQPLKQVIIRILDTRFNKLLETQITDRKGRYSFLVGKNEYQLVTEKSGYEKKAIKPVDLINSEQIVNLDIGLEKE